MADSVTVGLPSPSHKADASLKISPRRKGHKRYVIRYTLEDGGRGYDTRLTIYYKTQGGGRGSREIFNPGPGTDRGTIVINASKKITEMGAKVERINSHDTGLRGSDPNVFS
ncbi:hypothetical protein ACIBEJ_41660 [Nonomuraea sp. NPDC050790]|uniref:hypothetical protein n=1 Tax=Nonomuraea sp. NPDC050790 TaxID=3364371 RepID=UPI003798CDB7